MYLRNLENRRSPVTGKTSASLLRKIPHLPSALKSRTFPHIMGKARKSKPNKQPFKPYNKESKKLFAQSPSHGSAAAPKGRPTLLPTVPFDSANRILLVGDGDFSFSHSLLSAHGCYSLVATSYDMRSAVISKYPQASGHLEALENEKSCRVIHGVNASKLGCSGVSDGGGKEIRQGRFDRIVFNFPHVGGLTKDVNRQVRHNQGIE